ncbi:MAG: lipopolysaccharide kinase InaA family protein [Planctomycetota bacterium]|jgi:tRNA A-37 threonylcarbamoyl transferase component Bud32
MSSRLVVAEQDREWLKQAGISSVRTFLRYRPEQVAAKSDSSDAFPVTIPPNSRQGHHVFVKRYRYRRLTARLLGMFRGTLLGKSRARFEYDFLNQMRSRGLPAVRPIAYGEQRKNGFLRHCVLLTEAAEGKCVLDHLESSGTLDLPVEALAKELGMAIAAMHEAGIMHGGLFGRNILVGSTPNSWDVCFLDPDRKGKISSGSIQGDDVISDLSDLAASAVHYATTRQMLRFVCAYADRRTNRIAVRDVVARVSSAARPKADKERQRLAISTAIAWLGRRINANAERRQVAEVTSVREFLDSLNDAPVAMPPGAKPRRVQFRFVTESSSPGVVEQTVVLSDGRLRLENDGEQVDLTIESHPLTWLAIVNGNSDAFERLRHSPLNIQGDNRILLQLLQVVDAAQAGSRDLAPSAAAGR